MGQKEKARSIVDARYGFTVRTALSDDEWISAARRATEASRTRFKGRAVEGAITRPGPGQTVVTYSVVGPAGAVTLMTFALSGAATPQGSQVSLVVGDFLYQSGSLGMKPTINAAKVMDTFVDVLRAELAAG
ncbi:MAG: hypothetical protein IE923_16420 [Micrococcales bacterium]|nr:hypothetical protein [Micrococcales bacterium]